MIKMIEDNLWFGSGLGTFVYAYPRYQGISASDYIIKHSHNDYLELAAEMGATGLLAALVCIAVLFIFTLKRNMTIHENRFQTIGLGALAGCFSLLIHGSVDFNFHIPSNAILFIVCVAIAFICADKGRGEDISIWFNAGLTKGKKLFSYTLIMVFVAGTLVIVISPYMGDYYIKGAKIHQKAKEYDSALDAAQKAISFDPGNAELMAETGDILVASSVHTKDKDDRNGVLIKSLGYYEEAINACPVRSYYYSKKAYVIQRLGRLNEAEEALKRGVYFKPMDYLIHYTLAEFYLESGEFKKAFEEYRISIGLLGRYEYMMGIMDKLWEINRDYNDLKHAVPENAKIREWFASYMFKKGIHYERSGNNDKAVSIYKQLIKDNFRNAGTYINLSALYCRTRRYNEAIVTLKDGLERYPGDHSLYFHMGTCYSRMGP
jgi:tetratricopeptide (TPR) repeat protein